jgi:signal transduction histidine kinase
VAAGRTVAVAGRRWHERGAVRLTRRQAGTIGGVGLVAFGFAAVAIVLGLRAEHRPLWVLVAADVVGVSFLTAGLVAWACRPENRISRLMVLAGALWYATNLQAAQNPVLYALGYWLTYLPTIVMAHAALAYPTGRLRGRAERIGNATSYVAYLSLQATRYVVEGRKHPTGWPAQYPNTIWALIIGVDGTIASLVLMCWIGRRWWLASRAARRLHGPVWLMSLCLPALAIASVLASNLPAPVGVQLVLLLSYGVCMAALPFAFLSGLLRVRLARQRVADLVLALQGQPDARRLRDLLADTLDDPTLLLGFWSGTNGYVDPDGHPVALGGHGRAVTYVDSADPGAAEKLAVLVYDASLRQQRALVGATVAAARLALANVRLQATLDVRVSELAASRAQLVEAALTERRAIERDLHDGLQHRLLRLSWLAERAAAGPGGTQLVGELAAEARGAYATLRELAAGIHPAILTERGLAAAVGEQALRSPLPTLVDLPGRRWPPPVEATAFFVILEAITNAAKHGQPTHVAVRGWATDRGLALEIADDGAGGADPVGGTGLRGLADRVAALGGTLTVHSPSGQGTRVAVELPCG